MLDREKAGSIALAPMVVSIPAVDPLEMVILLPCPFLGHLEMTIELAGEDRMTMAPTAGIIQFANLGDLTVLIMNTILRPSQSFIVMMTVAIQLDQHELPIIQTGRHRLTVCHYELAVKPAQGIMVEGTRGHRHPMSQDRCPIMSIHIPITARLHGDPIRIVLAISMVVRITRGIHQ